MNDFSSRCLTCLTPDDLSSTILGMTNHPTADRVASEVRAELARQRKTAGELAAVLGMTPHTAGRRLNGEVPFDVVELVAIGLWLDIEPGRFLPQRAAA